jgi:hypothetical protein
MTIEKTLDRNQKVDLSGFCMTIENLKIIVATWNDL